VAAIYLGALLFGGLLILASLLGAGDHPIDLHSADAADAHAEGGGHARLMALFGLRFWSFATAFFGVTGLLLHRFGGAVLRAAAPTIAGVVGVAAGLGASLLFGKMTRESVGRVGDAAALVGREGRVLLPVARAQRGKVRCALPGGVQVDFLAESSDDEVLSTGADVIIIEVRGTVAVVARAPGGRAAS
jgi:hypothetical protein